MKKMISFIIEKWNKLNGKKMRYRLIAYINNSDHNTIMESAVVFDFSKRLAYNNFYEKLRKKHGDVCGIDIRFIETTKI